MGKRTALLALALAWSAHGVTTSAQTIELVTDLRPGGFDDGIRGLTLRETSGGRILLSGAETPSAQTLWSTTGEATGTVRLISNTWSGTADVIQFIGRVGDAHLLSAIGGELWRTDGTVAGTYRLGDEQVRLSLSSRVVPFRGKHLISSHRVWAYSASNDTVEVLLDGFATVTSETFQGDLLLVDGLRNVWATDGTPAGTRMLLQDAEDPVALGNGILFLRSQQADRDQLWFWDGTQPPRRLTNPGRGVSHIFSTGSAAFVLFQNAASRQQILITDGTSQGTRTLLTLRPNESLRTNTLQSGSRAPNLVRERLLIPIVQDDSSGGQLHSLTPTGQLEPLAPAPGGCCSGPTRFLRQDDVVFVYAEGGSRIVITDGTAEGTQSIQRFVIRAQELDQGLEFLTSRDASGREILHLDRDGSTRLLAEIPPRFSDAGDWIVREDNVVIAVEEAFTDAEPWLFPRPGRPGEPRQLIDLRRDNASSNPEQLIGLGQQIGLLADAQRELPDYLLPPPAAVVPSCSDPTWTSNGQRTFVYCRQGRDSFVLRLDLDLQVLDAEFLGDVSFRSWTALEGGALLQVGEGLFFVYDDLNRGAARLDDAGLWEVVAIDEHRAVYTRFNVRPPRSNVLLFDSTTTNVVPLGSVSLPILESFGARQVGEAVWLDFFGPDYRLSNDNVLERIDDLEPDLATSSLLSSVGDQVLIASRNRIFATTDGETFTQVALPPFVDSVITTDVPDYPGSQAAHFFLGPSSNRSLWRVDRTLQMSLVPGLPDLVSDGSPGPGVPLAEGHIFPITTRRYGRELWHVGEQGLRLVQDLFPGAASSDPDGFFHDVVRDQILFAADDGLVGRELFRVPFSDFGCRAGEQAACLADERFRVEVSWEGDDFTVERGRAVPITADTAGFWFFDPENIDLLVKVLDGTGINQSYWVFGGALSDVQYTIQVTDTATGEVRRFRNQQGQLASFGETGAFRDEPAGNSTPAPASQLLFRGSTSGSTALCEPSARVACLSRGQFEVRVDWQNFAGQSGNASVRPLREDTATFWFFDQNNIELAVKMLDGTAINGHYWLYSGALSNVGYTISVRNVTTGETRTWENPVGRFGSLADVEAFDGPSVGFSRPVR